LEREVFFLKQLEERADISVPRVLGYGRTESGGEYSLLTRMSGTTANRCSLDVKSNQAVLRELGVVLRHIHDMPREPFISNPLFPGDRSPVDALWRFGLLFDETVEAIARSAKPWSFRLPPKEVAHEAMAMLPSLDIAVALHNNPGPEHIFVDEKKGTLIGLIDFGDAYIGHPVHDLCRRLKPEDRSSLYEGYTSENPVDDSWERTWRVSCVLADMRAVLHLPDSVDQAYEEMDAIFR
jgi:hygromycin-B 7''-O-kinase